jgi:Tfp pilus assembly protein FimT
MGTNMMIFLVIVGILVLIGLPVIAIIEARRMDKEKRSILSKESEVKGEKNSKK